MSKNVKIDSASLRKGVGELLKSMDLEQKLKKLADERKQDWDTDTKLMPTRVIASIYTDDPEKIQEEMDTHRIVGGLR